MSIPANLKGFGDKVPFLYIFVEHVRTSILEAGGVPIKKRTSKQYLSSTRKKSQPWGTATPVTISWEN